MTQVTLIRRRSGFVNVPDGFMVREPGFEGAPDEHNEELGVYELPPGYEVGKTTLGERKIFSLGGQYACEISMHANGKPQLRGSDGTAPILKRVPTP